MYDAELDQYFELALDLPEKQRAKLISKLEKEQPDLGRQLRAALRDNVTNRDFALKRGSAGRPKLDALHHVAVTVDNIADGARWYTRNFGCTVSYQDETWAMLRFGNLSVALVLPEQHPPHFCLVRPDPEAFGEVKAHRDGTRSSYVRDPWGNAVEILAEDSLPD